MKLRCLFGIHGPMWTDDPEFLGPYSHRTEEGFIRICPFCKTKWQGSVIDRHVGYGVHVMTFGPWTKLKK